MKIIVGNKVYVQREDLAFIKLLGISLSESVYLQAFFKNYNQVTKNNRFEFVKFDGIGDINFFKRLDFIINFNEVKDMNEEEIEEYHQRIVNEKKELHEKYLNLKEDNDEEREKIATRFNQLNYMNATLKFVLALKKGKVSVFIPEGLEFKKIEEKENIEIKNNENNGIIKHLLNRRKK